MPASAQIQFGSGGDVSRGGDHAMSRSRGERDGGFRGRGFGLGADFIGNALQQGLGQQDDENTGRPVRRGRKAEEKKTGLTKQEKPQKPGANNPEPVASKDLPNPPPVVTTIDTSEKRTGRKHFSSVYLNDSGKEIATDEIDCHGHKGKIVVRDGVELTAASSQKGRETGYISIAYVGTKCDDCRMLQFVWREIKFKWRTTRLKKVVRSSGPDMKLTEDPDDPIYKLDSASPIDPSYEALGKANIHEDSLTIFDKPTPANDVANFEKSKYEGDLVQVDAFAHFDTFLVCDGEICAKVSWTVSDTWTSTQEIGKTTPPKYEVSEISTSAALNAGQLGKLLERFSWMLVTRN